MIITKIMLILQRPATQDEIENYSWADGLFHGMTPDERLEKGINRPTDLLAEDQPGKNVVYFRANKKSEPGPPLYNETYTKTGTLQAGIPGSTQMLKYIVASMLTKHVKANHESYYVLGELETNEHGAVGIRTLVARSVLSLRRVGH
jgi:hypothetical protein